MDACRNMEKILLVVITETEYNALHPFIKMDGDPFYAGLAILERGVIAGREVVLCKMGDMGSKTKGSVGAALSTVIDLVKPSLVLEVGICFGIKSDFKIGDVCVSKITFDYEYQKVENGKVHNRLRHINSSEQILSRLTHFSLHYKAGFKSRVGVYACGDKVVNDSDLKKQIVNAIPDVVAGDMESYTLGLTCEEKRVPWCVIKSSSDDGVNKDDDNQQRAAYNAAKFVTDFLESSVELALDDADFVEVDFATDESFFEGITQEITGKKKFRSENLVRNGVGLHIHHHPDMDGAWVIVYLYKARSIPQALRELLRHLNKAPNRVDLCIVSRELISEAHLKSYSEQLLGAGCENIYINPVKKFIYDRIIKEFIPGISSFPASLYVDQKVYRSDAEPISSRVYASRFIRSNLSSQVALKPISVILGQGGIGKTTLCRSIANHFERLSSKNEYLLLVTKSDILNGYSGMPINSIVDLYREYRNEHGEKTNTIGDRSFEIALSSGSLVMMIDGIDEIESALAGSFNMEGFINSIGDLNTTLGSCKVFLTSRHLGADRFRSLENAEVLELKGFTSEDVTEYIKNLDPNVHRSIRKIASKIQAKSGFVNPYLLSIAARALGRSDEEDISSEDQESNKLDSSEPFQYILSKMLGREIEKQSLGISIDSYYDLLEYIVVDSENSLTFSDFQSYTDTMFCPAGGSPTILVDSYLKCFLFKFSEGRVSIDHEEYVALIRIKALYSAISLERTINATDINRAMTIFGEDPSDSLGVREKVLQLLWFDQVDISLVNSNLIKYFDAFKSFVSTRIPRAKYAIYALHQFALKINRAKDAAEAAVILTMLHGENKITHMYILGDFPVLDLSGRILESCEFNGFKKFLRCKVDEGTSFRRCRVSNSSDLFSSEFFKPAMFDDDCYLDEALKLAITHSADKKEGREAKLRSDIKQIFKVMRLGLGFNPKSMNKIKQNTSLIGGKSYETLLGELCRSGILTLESESGTYSVRMKHQADAFVLCEENDAVGAIKEFITELSS